MSIIKTTEHDLLYLALDSGTYYACTDSNNFYFDTPTARKILDVTMLYTEKNRLYNIVPINGKKYYVWETNELWLYNHGWKVEVGAARLADGYIITENDKVIPTEGYGIVQDNNGLLKDGSVCVRDENRIIKGKLYIDKETNNLVISSFLGGGVTILPNGSSNINGSVFINPHTVLEDVKVFSYEENSYISVSLSEYLSNRTIYEDETKYLVAKKWSTAEDGYSVYVGEWNTTDDIYVNLPVSEPDEGHTVTIQVTLQSGSANETSSTRRVSDYLNGHDFTYGISNGALTDNVALYYSQLEAYDAYGVSITNIDINDEELIAINSAITEETEGTYPLTFSITTDTSKYKVWHEGNLDPNQILAQAVTAETKSQCSIDASINGMNLI